MRRLRAVFGQGRIGLTILAVAYVLPLLVLVSTSLKSDQQILTSPSGLALSGNLSSYRSAWQQGVPHILANTVIIALSVTVIIVVLGAPAAYALARVNGKVVTAVMATLVVLQMVPTASSVIPLFRVLGSWHLLGTRPGLIAADVALLLPFAILLLRPFFLAVPGELEEAAWTDGAGLLRAFFRIVLPLARNGLVTVAVFVFIITWGEFIYAVTLLNDPTAYPIGALISAQITGYGVRWNQLMALAVTAAAPVAVLFLFAQRRLREGLTTGAVK